jgi:hypothetical protein
MPKIRVVILASPSLFVEGVASRLRGLEMNAQILTIDPRASDAVEQTIAAGPQAVIFDSADLAPRRESAWTQLLQALPGLRILDLDSRTQRVRVVTSEEHTADDIRDLIHYLQPPAAAKGVE